MRNARTWDDEDEEYPKTLSGEKKRLASPMTKRYHLCAVEKSWYERWEKVGFFSADANSLKPPFMIVWPPPNVTGTFHIGRALTAAIEDTWFNGRECPVITLCGCLEWIATQVVVEKKLMMQKQLTRHDNGFYSSCAVWGLRGCFTMDEKRSNAMTEVFVRLHKQELLYMWEVMS